VIGDATQLPLRDAACDILLSGTVLMHLLHYPQAISETRRATRKWCIYHTVPTAENRPSTVLRKVAYGAPVVEIVLNAQEFLHLLEENGFVVHHTFPSVPHEYLTNLLGEYVPARTYLCGVA